MTCHSSRLCSEKPSLSVKILVTGEARCGGPTSGRGEDIMVRASSLELFFGHTSRVECIVCLLVLVGLRVN